MPNKNLTIVAFLFISFVLFVGDFSVKNLQSQNTTKSPEIGYFSYSPRGEKGGATIPASCESGYSHAGECYVVGDPVTGTSILGEPPSLPTNPGFIPPTPQCPCDSVANSCGMTNSGFGACGASCPMTPPSDTLCPLVNIEIGTTLISSGGTSGGATGATVTGRNEQMVAKGASCKIAWSASPATTCRITGPGVAQNLPISGTYNTPPITKTSIFNITCMNGTVVTASQSFSCRLNPVYEEAGGSDSR